VYVEAAYSVFASDQEMESHDEFFAGQSQLGKNEIKADQAGYACRCSTQAADHNVTTCYGQLRYGNYQFSLLVDYNLDHCVSPTTENQRRRQFSAVLKGADRLIYLYLEPPHRPDYAHVVDVVRDMIQETTARLDLAKLAPFYEKERVDL
jgi:hypothetical protein